MTGTKNIENNGPHTIYIGGKAIPPGESRDIPVDQLPAELRDAPAVVAEKVRTLDDDVLDLLEKPVKEVTAVLGGLTFEALDRVEELEGAHKKRKTVLDGVASERLSRADAALEAERAEHLAVALKAVTEELAAARAALNGLAPEATEEVRTAAAQRVADAEAKVKALTPDA